MTFWGRRIKRLAKSLTAAVLLAALPAAPALAYTAFYPQEYALGPGVTYYDAAAENSLGIQRAHYIEYRPSEDVQPIVAFGRGFYGRSTIGYVADYLAQDLNMQVLAGMNADFFNTGSGVPIGLVVQDGKMISSAGGAYAVGFREDGTHIFGKPKIIMTISDGTHGVVVENFNKTRSSYTVNLYDHNWGTETRLTNSGTNVLLEKVDPADEVKIGGRVKMRVLSVREENASTPFNDDQMVLTIAATGDATKVGVFYAGQEVELAVTADDPAWNEAVYAVGGKSLLLNGQAAVGDTPTGNAARTAIGFKADGTIIFFENDGRLKDFSIGLSPSALAQEMAALGAVNALNLDGGGSSVMSVRRFGFPLAVVNSPSDGQPRMVANHVFLINKQAAGHEASVLQIKTPARYILAGSSAELTVYALNAALAQANLPDTAEWSVSGGDGEIYDEQDNTAVFRAGDTPGLVRVAVESDGLTAYQNIYVLSSVSSLAIQQDGKTLATLNAVAGDKLNLSVGGVYKNQNVAMDSMGVKWSVSGDIGTVDEDGVFHAGGRDSSGMITAQAGTTIARLPVVLQNAGAGPNIVAVNLPNKLAEGETGEFSFRVNAGNGSYFPDKEQITLLLDGQAVDFDYAWATGIVNAELDEISGGVHRLTLIVEDNEGLLARKSVTVKVGDTANSLSYADVAEGHWAAECIGYLEARGLMRGESDAKGTQTFNPGRNLTRAEFAVIAARYLKLDTAQEVSLPFADKADIPGWALGAVQAVYADGVMRGEDVKGNIYFYPRNNISRQEAMAVISRILGDKYSPAEQSFTDAAQISGWAKEHIERLVTLGFVGGYEDGTIRPLANITRAEIAKILFNLY